MAKAATQAKKVVEAPRPTLKQVEFGAPTGDAKTVAKEVGAVARTVYMVPIEHLHTAPGYNVRVVDTPEYKAGIEELKDSFIEQGFYNTKPLSGFVGKLPDGKDGIFITDGHRRLDAAKLARADGAEKLEKLPVILKPAATSAQDLTISLIRENAQSNLTMMEKAVAAKRLLNAGMAKAEVAKVFNCTERYVDDFVLLVQAPKAIRALVTEGKLTGTLAVKELRADAKNDTKEAEKKLVGLAEKKAGGERVTAKDTSPAAPKAVGEKMQTLVVNYGLEKGQTAKWTEVMAIAALFPDTDWYDSTEQEDTIIATETFHVRAVIRRPKREEVVDESAKRPRGRPRKEQPVGEEMDPMTMGKLGVTTASDDDEDEDEEIEDSPDLRDLGIAEPEDPAEGL